MRIIPSKKLYLPAFSIIAVVFILLVLIGASTYQNLHRERKKSLDFLHRQGMMLINAIEAGARVHMLQNPQQEQEIIIDHYIRELALNEDIAYIYLFDQTGYLLHHSDGFKENRSTDWRPEMFEKNGISHRLVTESDGSRIYELANRFSIMGVSIDKKTQSTLSPSAKRSNSKEAVKNNEFIVLGLMMTAMDAAQQADFHHAIIMAVIVLALGTGTLFFLFVIQNYYLVDRSLKQAQNYTQQVISSMSDGMLSIDIEGRVVSFNRAAIEMLSILPDNMKGFDLRSVLNFDDSGIEEALKQGRTAGGKEILYSKTGEVSLPIGITTSPILEADGTCQGAVLILRDLREIKQLEAKVRRSEKLAAIGQLAAAVAHEVRNPLSSIKGFAQFLRHALKNQPKEREYAQIMVNEIDRINRVVGDLLSFANPKDAQFAPTDIGQLIQHTLKLVQMDAHAKAIDLRLETSSDMGTVNLDSEQITQAFLNLLINALKFVPQGGHVLVKTERKESENTFVFQIEDDGPGISPDQMPKIFEPFYTTSETGTGLGLSIVHKIMENHQGEIEVVSPLPGKDYGTCFTIRLPITPKNQQHIGNSQNHED